MATISTTTNTSPFAYPGNTLLDRRPGDGRLYAMVKTSTANTYQVFISDDKGTTWSGYTSTVRASIVDSGSVFVTNVNWLYWTYRTNESSQDRIYLRRLNLYNGVWASEILVDAVANGGVAGAVFGGLDLMEVTSAGQDFTVIAAGFTQGASIGVTLRGVYINASSAIATLNIVPGNRTWLYTGSGRIQPSIDIEHNGDGKSATAPHLWIAFGRQRLQMVKMAWHGGGWSGPVSAQELLPTGMAAREYTSGRWDGARWLMVVPNPTTTDTVMLLERNQANTTTVTRQTPPHPTGVIRHTSLSYNHVTKDTRVYAIGTSTTVLYFVDFVRATGLWTSWATVLATAVLGSTGQEWGVRRGSVGSARHDVYTAHTGAPNTLTHTSQTLTYAPFTPTWVNTSGQAADVAATLLLDWTFSDSDPGDSQKDFAISRQIGAGALAYFRASDSTWQAGEVQNASTTSSRTLAAAWGAGSDAAHTYKVKVWDQSNAASAYSDALVVIASTVVNPAIVTPTPAEVLTGDSVTVTWTAAEQTAYRVTLSITAGPVLYDTGWVAGTDLIYTVPVTLLNSGAYTVTLETRNNEGLPSVAQTRDVTVAFLEPNTPTNVNTAVPASGWIAVVITNPTPSGGRPAVAYNDVYRRPVGDTSDGVRMAAGVGVSGTYNDWQAVSGVNFEYRILTHGVNGTAIFGAWQA